jgi:hypothetical protein
VVHLGRAEDRSALDLGDRFGHFEPAAHEVHAADAKGRKLAEAETGVAEHLDDEPVAPCGDSEILQLTVREEALLRLAGPRK